MLNLVIGIAIGGIVVGVGLAAWFLWQFKDFMG